MTSWKGSPSSTSSSSAAARQASPPAWHPGSRNSGHASQVIWTTTLPSLRAHRTATRDPNWTRRDELRPHVEEHLYGDGDGSRLRDEHR